MADDISPGERARLVEELRRRCRSNPITARIVGMMKAGWFKVGRPRQHTVAMVRMGPLAAVSVIEVLNELDWLRAHGFLGKRPPEARDEPLIIVPN